MMYSITRNGETISLTDKEVSNLVMQKSFNDFKEEFKKRVPDFTDELFEMYLFEISSKSLEKLDSFAEEKDINLVEKNIQDIDFALLTD